MNIRCVKWLYDELPRLVAGNIVPAPVAEAIRAHYGEVPAGRGKRLAITVFSILGGLLVGGGLILLLAHNWSGLPRAVRTLLAFLPLVAGQIVCGITLWKKKGLAWREGGATFLFLAVGATIALVSQIYHLPGDFGRFALTWSLLGLPLVYLLDASFPVILYLAGVTSWAFHQGPREGAAVTGLWMLSALAAPFIVMHVFRSRYGERTSAILWAVTFFLCAAVGFTLADAAGGLWIVAYAALFALLYLGGRYLFGAAPSWRLRPFQTVGLLGGLALAFLLTYEFAWEIVEHTARAGSRLDDATRLLLVVAAPAAALCLSVISVRRRMASVIPLGILPVAVWLGYGAAGLVGRAAAGAVMSVYVLGVGVTAIVRGVRGRALGLVNGGMLLTSVLIVARFFDSSFSLVARGAVFVVLGLGFLTANILLSRQKGVAR
ncbi:MAG: DUF2157 domain-containing protein [Kiritimatiellae bacterium]|nr:DUF2157 domain-containing protein [Kiritimatiellia bacterium]